MNEQELIERTTEVLAESGTPENVEAAGIFNPRGHTGSMFAGGFIGDGIAGAGPDLVDAIGTVGGAVAGAKLHDAATGLPEWLVVAVTPTAVVGFDTDGRRRPTRPIFRIDRSELETKVHQRVNVRILELIHKDTGSSVQLEGNRIPLLHTKDVIKALHGDG
jgi:hypothetical protein